MPSCSPWLGDMAPVWAEASAAALSKTHTAAKDKTATLTVKPEPIAFRSQPDTFKFSSSHSYIYIILNPKTKKKLYRRSGEKAGTNLWQRIILTKLYKAKVR